MKSIARQVREAMQLAAEEARDRGHRDGARHLSAAAILLDDTAMRRLRGLLK